MMTHRYFTFHFQKALQAAGYILRMADGRMNYIDLIKMLYIADRECLGEEGETITGDSVSALKKGPVLRTVLNLIKDKDPRSGYWHDFIGSQFNDTAKKLEVYIKKSPGDGNLYRYEKEILDRVFDKYKDKDLIAYTHSFPEWQKYEELLNSPDTNNSYPITIRDILEGIGKLEMLATVESNIADELYYSELYKR